MGFSENVSFINIFACMLAADVFALQAWRLSKVIDGRKLAALCILRGLAVACIMLCIMGFQLTFGSRKTATIFLVDRSLSAGSFKKEAEDYINFQLSENRKKGEKAAVVAFGSDTMIEYPFSKALEEVSLQSKPSPDSSNIEKALDFCDGYFPKGTNKRLVIMSDGIENAGKASGALKTLREKNVNIVFYPLKPARTKDIQLSSIKLPENVHQGERVPVNIIIDSEIDSKGSFYLFNEKDKLLEKQISVRQGRNSFSFDIALEKDKSAELRGEISFKEDSNSKNNTFTVFPGLEDKPSILLIGEDKDTANIKGIIQGMDIKVTSCRPSELNTAVGFLSQFSEIIMANVPKNHLSEGFEKSLKTCVEQKGTGFILVGGDKTFALGGYEKTELEELLPVSCKMKGNKKQPNAALVLVIDCSGSMADKSGSTKKIAMAKKAAASSVDILEAADYIGVLGFSDLVEWIVPFGRVEDKDRIKEQIGTLAPKGGTVIIPSITKAREALKAADAKVKHIILMTDGQGEKKGYASILESCKADGITLSAVGIGQDSDKELLQSISEACGGRCYFASDIYDVPTIFARETYLSTKKYLNNRDFQPRVGGNGEFYGEKALPKLKGYIGTGIKEGADILLKSDMDDPILARWQYGAGRVMVWTADMNGGWSRDWISWDKVLDVWGSIISFCFSPFSNKAISLRVDKEGCNLQINASIKESSDLETVEARIIKGSGGEAKIVLKKMAPGQYKGSYALDSAGDYIVELSKLEKGKTQKKTSQAVRLDYSPEYSAGADSKECLYALYQEAVISNDSNVFGIPIKRRESSRQSMEGILLPLALAAFIGELLARKLL